eukprot:TRINITY_DN11043_c0_g1_i3.p1 TRINITY_DN11043_c0_g1~~TRINITY_DN11043_c0_g1_i3.p1  ORF type:complete len:156 (+),score=44.78 TRINITY_DN11043_c0_g1_i3:415-882(+)
MCSDAPLLLPPGQLALAALAAATRSTSHAGDFSRYLKDLLSRTGKGKFVEEFTAALQRIEAMRAEAEAKPSDAEEVKKIDKQLKFCRNPVLLQEELRKREKKEQRRSKRAASHHDVSTSGAMLAASPAAVSSAVAAPSGEDLVMREAKRRKSSDH